MSDILSIAVNKPISVIKSHLKGDTLKARCARGVLAVGIGIAAWRGMKLVRSMIFTRILPTGDLGLMAMVMAAYAVFEAIGDVGIKQSVIRSKEGATEEYLNVTWWFQTIRGIGLFAIAFLLAPVICSFYEMPELLWLLRFTFIAMLFEGLQSTRVYVLEKEFRFGKAMFLLQGGRLVSTIVTIILAFYLRSVWALVTGLLVGSVLRCCLSYVFCPFIPQFSIDRKCLQDLLKFARGMFGLPILTMLALQTDVLVLGKMVSKVDLGMYYVALALSQAPVGWLYEVFSPVLLPAFAEKQDDNAALCRAVLKTCRIGVVLGMPLTAFMVACSPTVLSIVFGAKFSAVAVPFSILCISMFINNQRAFLGTIYLALGKPHIHRRLFLVRSAAVVLAMYPGIKLLGLAGAASALLFANLLAFFVYIVGIHRQIGLSYKDYSFCFLPGVAMVSLALLPVLALRWSGLNSWSLDIIVAVVSFLISYFLYFASKYSQVNLIGLLMKRSE